MKFDNFSDLFKKNEKLIRMIINRIQDISPSVRLQAVFLILNLIFKLKLEEQL
jgi:hypothetical protein